ncbi:hypothetical protein BDA96_10G236300 [Sorghum bicolor]|uniref:Uncharacterized protein n=1 Tax=Sorghum bicolor TaxID=4558 RepID=A0A921Q3J2_SORBI|nr:hypothetical protein BDA96_10G236300 [Sorghum bicolor]
MHQNLPRLYHCIIVAHNRRFTAKPRERAGIIRRISSTNSRTRFFFSPFIRLTVSVRGRERGISIGTGLESNRRPPIRHTAPSAAGAAEGAAPHAHGCRPCHVTYGMQTPPTVSCHRRGRPGPALTSAATARPDSGAGVALVPMPRFRRYFPGARRARASCMDGSGRRPVGGSRQTQRSRRVRQRLDSIDYYYYTSC